MGIQLQHVEAKLAELGLSLPDAGAVAGNYVAVARFDNALYVSGQISKNADGSLITGKLGSDLDVDAGQKAAQSSALQIIAQALAALGESESIARIIKLNGFVNAAPDFEKHPAVINGASDLIVAVFGEAVGNHARAAVGMGSLPFNVAVEIDAVIGIESA